MITGVGGRWRWSADEKARILEEAVAPGAIVSIVARRHGLSPKHVFTWRRQAKRDADDHSLAFAPVVVAPAAPRSTPPASREAVIKVVVEGAVIRVPSVCWCLRRRLLCTHTREASTNPFYVA